MSAIFLPILILFGVYLYCSLVNHEFEHTYRQKLVSYKRQNTIGENPPLKDFIDEEYTKLLKDEKENNEISEEELSSSVEDNSSDSDLDDEIGDSNSESEIEPPKIIIKRPV